MNFNNQKNTYLQFINYKQKKNEIKPNLYNSSIGGKYNEYNNNKDIKMMAAFPLCANCNKISKEYIVVEHKGHTFTHNNFFN